jgi:hypothetical protein
MIALANIAFKFGRSVRFDPAAEKIVGDDEAARLARPQYRDPWKFPEQYLLGLVGFLGRFCGMKSLPAATGL